MQVVHNEEKRAFETVIDGTVSHLDYETRSGDDGAKEMVFTHTFCAPEHRGKGVAAALVKAGLAYARENGYRIVPVCSYVVSYLERHPQN